MLVAAVAADVALGVLLIAGVGHLRRRASFSAQLRAQRTWPHAMTPVLATGVGIVETVAGAAGAAVLLRADATPALLRTVLVAAAALYTLYGAFLWSLWMRSAGPVPCACSARVVPVSGWSTGRAFALAVLAGLAAATAGGVPPLLSGAGVVAVTAAMPIGIALWVLPEALLDPSLPTAGEEAWAS